MKVQFNEEEQSSELEIVNGDYRRTFKRAEQPFEVSEEEGLMLKRTGHFEEVSAKKKRAQPAGANDTSNANTNGAGGSTDNK